jgi:hypothetical protein
VAITWVEGTLQSLDVEWLHVENICEVRDVELLKVRVSGITDSLNGYGYFDLFQLCKNLLNEKITGNETIYLPLDEVPAGAITEIPVFGAVIEAQIVAAHIVPKTNITGNDTNYMALKLINKETGTVICTRTFLNGINAPAYKVTDFGPANETNGTINLGQSVSFVKEEVGSGMTLPQSILVIQWNLR